jgi:hypothetical protein
MTPLADGHLTLALRQPWFRATPAARQDHNEVARAERQEYRLAARPGRDKDRAHDTITRHRRGRPADQTRVPPGPQPRPFNQVTALAAGNCKVAKISCAWDIANWGGGWSFAPDYSPTGETLFKCGAIANSGGYCSTQNDTMIDQTLTSNNTQDLYTWQNYLSAQLPMEWQPNADYQLTETVNNLKGVTPQSPTLNITPENWYFVK